MQKGLQKLTNEMVDGHHTLWIVLSCADAKLSNNYLGEQTCGILKAKDEVETGEEEVPIQLSSG